MEITFFTTSLTKLAHVRHILREDLVRIRSQRHYGIPYEEPRISDSEEIILRSLESARRKWPAGNRKILMVEDTSVRIENLSSPEWSVPGTDVKFWMRDMTFELLDQMLRERGNNRAAIVTSHIGVSIPNPDSLDTRFAWKLFTSSTKGFVTENDANIETQPYYPWLDSKSFNRWFVPNGALAPLSSLHITEADRFDFRSGAVLEAVSWIKKQTGTSSEPSHHHYIAHPQKVVVVSGYSCSGKTTFSEALADKFDLLHCEASDFMKFACYERHGWKSETRISQFAKQALSDDPSLVPRLISEFVRSNSATTLLVTGLRAPAEIEAIRTCFPRSDIKVIFIEGKAQTRFNRALNRPRRKAPSSLADFLQSDKEQAEMGLDGILDIASRIIVNERSLREFKGKCSDIANRYKIEMLPEQLDLWNLRPAQPPDKLFLEILLVLGEKFDSGQYFTTTEIAALINNRFYQDEKRLKSKNNVSRHFNQYFRPHYEAESTNGTNRFRLSQTGRGIARHLIRKASPSHSQ